MPVVAILTPPSALKQRRQAAGLGQRRLAQLVGTSQAAISRYESGRKRARPATAERILAALAISGDEIGDYFPHLAQRHPDEVALQKSPDAGGRRVQA